ncbi:VIR protein [Plasmodium vivax]|uniref:VIR protein n=1 Tax=Plasmodium vivax TaxID=5855 RepID=A0A1G4H2U4_PLAVI|nr:VIR protein [Plasmodium vivax]
MGTQATEKDYKNFDIMDKNYIYKAVISLNRSMLRESSSENNSIINCDSSGITGRTKTVCKKFNNLIRSLCSSKSVELKNKCLNNSDYEYLNFWVNCEFNGEGFFDNTFTEDFHANMQNKIGECVSNDKLINALKLFKHEDLKKMKILDELYKSYHEMHEIIISASDEIAKCLKPSTKCVEDYKSAIRQFQGQNNYFDNALMTFKKIYEALAYEAFRKNISYLSHIAKIPEDPNESKLTFYTIGDNRNKIILISLFGSVIAVVLVLIYFYRFTHSGNLMRARSRKKKKKFNNQDDNMKNSLCINDPNIIRYNNRKYNLAYHS